MPILVRSRNGGKTFELRVTHPHLEKPVYRTFDTRLDAERSGVQALVQLARHEVPVWLQHADSRPLKTIGEAIRAYSLASAVPASTERLLETLEGDLGAHKLDEVTYAWGQDWIRGMKLEHHSAPGVSKPDLPEARPGDQILWNRSGVPQTVKRPLPRPPTARARRKPSVAPSQTTLHPVVHGARAHFDDARTSYDSSYLKPAKRVLVDLVVSKGALDKALSFANQLFLELEAHDCRVVIAAHGDHLRREEVDGHEVPRKKPIDNYYSRLWSPARVTVVYIGTVAIGLTIIELSEEVDVRYLKGEYVRLDQETPAAKRGRYANDYSWTTKKDYPTGRLCLQAYSPDWRGKWTQQWREAKDRDLTSRIRTMVKELMDAASVVARLIEEGERKAEIQRKQWEEEKRQIERQQAEERAKKARQESTDELLSIVNAWNQAKRIEEFFSDVEGRLSSFETDRRVQMMDRLSHARRLLGTVDALERFQRWRAPSER